MTGDRRIQRAPAKRMLALVFASWVSPVIAGLGAILAHATHARGRKNAVLTLSLAGNVLFISVLTVGYYHGRQRGPTGEGSPLAAPSGFVPHTQGPLHFCMPSSEATRPPSLGHDIFIASEGVIRARFEFADAGMSRLREVTVSDAYGRPWVSANLEDGSMILEKYGSLEGTEPQMGLRDKDGDGMWDIMIDWEKGQSFKRASDILWARFSEED